MLLSEDLQRIENLKTYFHTWKGILKAVDGINMKIGKSEVVGLVGESGSGKSVTSLSIMRLVPPTGKIEGKIIYKGKNLLEMTEKQMRKIRGKEISMIFQDPVTFLDPLMKIKDQIGEVVTLHDAANKNVEKVVIEMLREVGINDQRIVEYYPHQLSSGMLQRILITIALSCNPSLLIADEPTSALDVTVQLQIMNLLNKVKRERDLSILMISHNLGILAEICDRIYVMYAGKIMEDADVWTMFEKPKHPYTIGLLKAIPTIDKSREALFTIDGSLPNPFNPPSGCRFHPRCPRAKAICRKQEPPHIEIEQGHEVYCWLYD